MVHPSVDEMLIEEPPPDYPPPQYSRCDTGLPPPPYNPRARVRHILELMARPPRPPSPGPERRDPRPPPPLYFTHSADFWRPPEPAEREQQWAEERAATDSDTRPESVTRPRLEPIHTQNPSLSLSERAERAERIRIWAEQTASAREQRQSSGSSLRPEAYRRRRPQPSSSPSLIDRYDRVILYHVATSEEDVEPPQPPRRNLTGLRTRGRLPRHRVSPFRNRICDTSNRPVDGVASSASGMDQGDLLDSAMWFVSGVLCGVALTVAVMSYHFGQGRGWSI
ncbi:hypothetical protein FPQ18DRAFT_301553 [Pyronema domesticum]|uniref:Uncharacterized protein n=1 Tax=Pyronema omphalodes (strain CBS 100304) TaxID=1076935 RepID=U4LG57_PYROM|nr:hypothetical protein FPQ18DRAFT_301553 [Pyronema domesticum]CCX14913.1 Protein of unknown function [Pyronema omphalodes CBS 100304]